MNDMTMFNAIFKGQFNSDKILTEIYTEFGPGSVNPTIILAYAVRDLSERVIELEKKLKEKES